MKAESHVSAGWEIMRRRKRMLEDLDQDIRDHIERETQDNIDRGMPPEEARYAALRKFGNATRMKEETREIWSFVWLEQLWQDICFAFRTLRKSPGFTAVAVLTLALGVGANTAIFSAVNAVLLRPLPYRDADQLVMIWQTAPQIGLRDMPVTEPDFSDYRAQGRSFRQVEALYLNKEDCTLTGVGQPARVGAMDVSVGLFSLLGIQPEIGRTFVDGEDQPGHEREVILSHKLWEQKFGGDPNAVGRSVTIDGMPYAIVGVMPSSFLFPPPMVSGRLTVAGNRELWLPLVMTDPSRENHGLGVIARLKPGTTIARARSEVETIAARLQAQYPKTNGDFGGTVEALQDMVVRETRTTLFVLLGAVGFVLLIACVNVANLLLARSVSRRREIATRAALGATRVRLIRQGLAESALISAFGGTLGILLASWTVAYLRVARGIEIPRIDETTLDWRVLAFCAGASVLTGLLCGVAPVWMTSAADANEYMKEGGRGSSGKWSMRLLRPLVIAEVALAIVPLVGAGLLTRSFERVLSVNPGFNAQHMVAVSLRLSRERYPSDLKIAAFATQLVEKTRALPGVVSAGTTNSLPIAGFQGVSFLFIESHTQPATLAETPIANERAVTPGYFSTMQIPLLQGRLFSIDDSADSARVAILNETAARRYFGNASPIGQRIKVDSNSAKSPAWTVIGVVGDVHQAGLAVAPDPEMYFPEVQRTWSVMTLAVRTGGDPEGLAKAIREQVWALDKDQAVSDVKTMEQVLGESLASRRFSLALMGSFAFVALLLSGIGIYGVIAYSVAQRTGEIGIRMALGAQHGDVLRLFLMRGAKLILIGVCIGIVAALALTRFMQSLVFEIAPTDPLTFACVIILLSFVALLACYIPARRAMRVDPMVALRYE
jgi:predicted permease